MDKVYIILTIKYIDGKLVWDISTQEVVLAISIVNTILNPGNKMILSSENVKGQQVNVLKT